MGNCFIISVEIVQEKNLAKTSVTIGKYFDSTTLANNSRDCGDPINLQYLYKNVTIRLSRSHI